MVRTQLKDGSSHRNEDAKKYKGAVKMVVWTHDSHSSLQDVVVDMSLIPNAREGDIAEIRTLGEKPKRLYFIVKKNKEAKMENAQLSLHPQLLSLLEIPPRDEVAVRLKQARSVRATTVEVLFKDAYMTRADLWRLGRSLVGQCIHVGQRISYLGVVRLAVNDIYKTKHKTMSAYIDENTKIVYRSASARSIFFIQMSAEMWNFEENSEVVFHKLVNSFLPEVFRRWRDSEAHHVVTIVLFSSVDVSVHSKKLKQGERPKHTQDYFRVVVDQVQVSRWNHIMARLRYEFQQFQETVLQRKSGKIEGQILPAVKGNIMEAISLAITLVSSKFNDRDLRRTNLEVVIVTPGTGIFDVDYDLFYQTSMKLLSIEIGIDIVCLSRQPLHVTPLFRWIGKDPSEPGKERVINALPSWLDISYWHARESHSQQWIPRCKIYEIQMMGLMENDVSSISIDYLNKNLTKDEGTAMEAYDKQAFLSKAEISNTRAIHEALTTGYNQDLLRPKIKTLDTSQPTGTLRVVSKHTETEPVFASTTSHKTTAESLANVMKTPRKISALSKLLGLGSESGLLGSSPSHLDSPKVQPVKNISLSEMVSMRESLDTSTTPQDLPSAQLQIKASKIAIPVVPAVNSSSRLAVQRGKAGSSYGSESIISPSKSAEHSMKKSYGMLANSGSTYSDSPPGNNAARNALKSTDFDANNHVWVTIANPSNIPRDRVFNISNYGRWKNVFPLGAKRQTVKWRSIKSPASLPLSSNIFPSLQEFEGKYVVQNYDVTLAFEQEDHMSPGDLLEEMVAMRLLIGFQIVTGEAVSDIEQRAMRDGRPSMIVQIIPENYEDIRIYLTRANEIHRLVCSAGGTINVQLYSKPLLFKTEVDGLYQPFVKAKFDDEYRQTLGNFFDPSIRIVNWNALDQLLAGYDDIQDNERLFKVRFALIPSDIPRNNSANPGGEEKLTVEEVRVEGLRRIVIQLHKNAYMTRAEKDRRNKTKKEIVSPEILFYTGELSSYVQQLMETDSAPARVFGERFNRTIKFKELINELLGESGIKLQDRKWHRKLHKNCFVGHQLVSWLITNFTDIHTAEEAVEYGNLLQEKEVFSHVEHRHAFLDGHYFYQINKSYLPKEYSEEKPVDKSSTTSSWFGKAKPSTSSSEATPESGPVREQSFTNISELSGSATSSEKQNDSNTLRSAGTIKPPAKKAYVSRALQVDVDPQNRSPRQELITVHIDRAHNPDNAFHLRLEWFNTTPKLIDEMIVNLARIADQHSLKLVQVPIEEISQIPESNPFASVVRTKFSVDPEIFSSTLDDKPLAENPHYYHEYFLARMGFCRDTGSTSSFLVGDLDILCSWGRPFYNYKQFIHKSGTVLCQILGNKEFLLMTNSLHVSRIGVPTGNTNNTANNGINGTNNISSYLLPGSTPIANPVGQSPSGSPTSTSGLSCKTPNLMTDPDEIQEHFRARCEDESDLTKIFTAASAAWVVRKPAISLDRTKPTSFISPERKATI